jgi:hypothetical protein
MSKTHNIKIKIKGELTLRALEVLEHTAHGISDLLFIFTMPYGTSLGKTLHELDRRNFKRESWSEQVRAKHQERQRLHNLVYQLRKNELIETATQNKLRITSKGRRLLQKLQRRKQNALPQPFYTAPPSSLWQVVIFDIPEKERRKRAWLRSVLNNLKFTMIQKSVWIGKAKLPEDFLRDLARLHLLEYIHIFAIHRPGTISNFRP